MIYKKSSDASFFEEYNTAIMVLVAITSRINHLVQEPKLLEKNMIALN